MLLCLTVLLTACSKKDDPEPEIPPVEDTTPTDESMFYKLHRVENFAGDTEYDGPIDGPRAAIYFSLETKKGIQQLYQKSNLWDISFSDIANAKIGTNNGKNSSSLGAGSSGVGGIYITDKTFEEITDIPADNEFKISNFLDENGAFGNGLGWAMYDWDGNKVDPNGDYASKGHVCYALGNPITLSNGKTIVRTLVVKTAKGNYAKIKMISIYQDITNPLNMMRKSKYPYFTFEYVLVPAGSTKFEIK